MELPERIRELCSRPKRPHFTEREKQIAALIGDCYTDKEIATELGISERGVRVRTSTIYDKCQIDRARRNSRGVFILAWAESKRV